MIFTIKAIVTTGTFWKIDTNIMNLIVTKINTIWMYHVDMRFWMWILYYNYTLGFDAILI
jgi:hypothetical protein